MIMIDLYNLIEGGVNNQRGERKTLLKSIDGGRVLETLESVA